MNKKIHKYRPVINGGRVDMAFAGRNNKHLKGTLGRLSRALWNQVRLNWV